MLSAPRAPRPGIIGAGAGAALSAAGFVALLAVQLSGGGQVDAPWAPALDLRLHFTLDGVGAVYALLATSIGATVFAYAGGYMPGEIEGAERPRAQASRFHGLVALFAVSMVGLATAQDMVLLFVFWDLTAVCSYLLIATDRDSHASRRAALTAIVVTGVTAVGFLVGIVLLAVEYGTTSVPRLLEVVPAAGGAPVAAVLIAVAALAKSAQVPLHFWLPRAMAAPTPVSAYLHSAAMVAAGVLLISRLHPLLAATPALLDVLVGIGLLSMLAGGVLALAAGGLKRILAYSTIAQYGYVTVMLGLGSKTALIGASLYVLAHGLAKSSLFMVAGAVTHATGEDRLSKVGGLARTHPWLAFAAGASAASLAALPLTAGFFADEAFFKAAAEAGTWAAVAAVAGAAFTFAYMARFWAGIFLGRRRAGTEHGAGAALQAPAVVLALLVVAGGIVWGPLLGLSEDAAAAMGARDPSLKLSYTPELSTEKVMALLSWTAGLLLFAGLRWAHPAAVALARAGAAAGPDRIYGTSIASLNRFSDRLHALEGADLRGTLAAVMVPGALIAAAAVIVAGSGRSYTVGELSWNDAALVAALITSGVAAVAATRPRRHTRLVLALSAVGFNLAAVYALLGAPDVALVAAVIETLLTLLLLGVLARLPTEVLRREARLWMGRRRRALNVGVALFAAGAALATTWSTLSAEDQGAGAAEAQIDLADEAHGKDVVTVILADFRGLDTLGEVTVILTALVGVAALLRRGRLW